MTTLRPAILVPLFLSLATAQGEVQPRSTVKKGASVWLVHESSIDAAIEVQGQSIETNEQVAWTLNLRVDAVDADGNYTVTTEIVRVQGKLTLAAGRGATRFDSAGEPDAAAAPEARQAAACLTSIVGTSFQCTVNPLGRLVALGAGTMAARTGTSPSSALHRYDEALLRQWVEGSFGFAPEKRTAAGARWQRTAAESCGPVPTLQQMTANLTVVDPDFFVIETTGTAALDMARARAARAAEDAHVIGDLEATKVKRSAIAGSQRTCRRDGFVLASNLSTQLAIESADEQFGEIVATITATRTVARTSAPTVTSKTAGVPPAKNRQHGATR